MLREMSQAQKAKGHMWQLQQNKGERWGVEHHKDFGKIRGVEGDQEGERRVGERGGNVE